MEMLLRDSFANYVVQTSLDYAEPDQRAEVRRNGEVMAASTMKLNWYSLIAYRLYSPVTGLCAKHPLW